MRISAGAKYWQDRQQVVLERKNGQTDAGRRILIGHFVVSIPSSLGLWVHGWSAEKARTLAYEIVRRHRVAGGAVILHPWRRDDEDLEYAPDGYWHFHVVGIHLVPTTPGGSDAAPDGQAIIFKHIKDEEYGNYGGLRSMRAIGRLIQYQLTHAGLEDGRHALTYFGLLSYRSLPKSLSQESYPDFLKDGSKTNPASGISCPVCGSRDVENCIDLTPVFSKSSIRDAVACGTTPRPYDICEESAHPEPAYEPTPGLVEKAAAALEEDFQARYDAESNPDARHALTKERRHARAELAERELELFNMDNLLVEVWVWLKGTLAEGPVPRDRLLTDSPELLDECIQLNLKTGRLGVTPGDRFYLNREYTLDDALDDLRVIIQSGEPKDGRDLRLERHLLECPSEILTDTGFVFGSYLAAARAGVEE